MKRASELSSPVRDGHPLRQFGQSDREQIEASHTDANVPQVLTLLNGFVDQEIMRPESLLMRSIEAAPRSRFAGARGVRRGVESAADRG